MSVGHPYVPQQQPKKSHKALIISLIIAGIVVLLCGLFVVNLGKSSAQSLHNALPSPEPTTSAPKSSVGKKAAPAPEPTPTIGEGVWHVGEDVKAGRYKLNDVPEGGCYWEVSTDDAGQNIVSNGNPTGGHPQVTLRKGQFFTSLHCGVWTLIK